jgi:putative ABC transport system permease protein
VSVFSTIALAFRALWRNKVRSFLTMLGIICGIATVIATIAYGMGTRAAVDDVFTSMGTNLLIVTNGSVSTGGAAGGLGSRYSLTWTDLDALENGEVPTIKYVTPVLSSKVQVASEDANWNTSVLGVEPSYFAIKSWRAKAGALFDQDAAKTTGAKVAVIGATVATQLYGTSNPVGQPIRINGQPYEVVALLETRGQNAMGQDQDDTVIVPLKTYLQKMDRGIGKYISKGQLFVSVRSEAEIEHAQSQLSALLRARHNLSASDDDDFRIRNLADIAMSKKAAADQNSTLLAVVAAMSLLVGGVGVMNIMLVSVIERTREIGTRMAVGAKPTDVMTQFLVEALVLAAIGGLLGVGGGAIGAKLLANLYKVRFFFPVATAVIAFAVSGGVGVVFGLYPAIRASRLDPITALRYET